MRCDWVEASRCIEVGWWVVYGLNGVPTCLPKWIHGEQFLGNREISRAGIIRCREWTAENSSPEEIVRASCFEESFVRNGARSRADTADIPTFRVLTIRKHVKHGLDICAGYTSKYHDQCHTVNASSFDLPLRRVELSV